MQGCQSFLGANPASPLSPEQRTDFAVMRQLLRNYLQVKACASHHGSQCAVAQMSVVCGYLVATRYKTMYRWRYSAGIDPKEKEFTTNLIAMNPCLYWCRIVYTLKMP